MLARTRERLAALERELPYAKSYPCDVTEETQLDSTIDAIRGDLGTPKVLIHNAVDGAFGNFLEINRQVINRNFQGNAMALLHLANRLTPAMVAEGGGANRRERQHLPSRQSQLCRIRTNQVRATDPRRIHSAT
jgi:short-subunit dehydrogenase